MSDFASPDLSPEEAVWWYRDGGRTFGPVTIDELRRLAAGPIGPAILVWRETFGKTWRPLDAALAPEGRPALPPPVNYGRWTKSFAQFEAEPEKTQWSAIGLLGPLGYLFLGMWRQSLVLLSASMVFRIVALLIGAPNWIAIVPAALIGGFCIVHMKRDYYRYRVRGERMWQPLRPIANGYVCASVAPVLLIALVSLGSPQRMAVVDPSTVGISGIWQNGEAENVVLDLDGNIKTIAFGGKSYSVLLTKSNFEAGVVVYADRYDPQTLITIAQHWDEKHEMFTLDLFLDDRFQCNLAYLRPI